MSCPLIGTRRAALVAALAVAVRGVVLGSRGTRICPQIDPRGNPIVEARVRAYQYSRAAVQIV